LKLQPVIQQLTFWPTLYTVNNVIQTTKTNGETSTVHCECSLCRPLALIQASGHFGNFFTALSIGP